MINRRAVNNRVRRATGLMSVVVFVTSSLFALTGGSTVAAVDDQDWLGIVNTYRAMSGLGPVTENPTWSSEAVAHSCYMLENGISHDEDPSKPGYTPGGDVAGNSGNVAVSGSISATPRNHIDLWMTGPFHAIGILRYSLTSTGFGLCASDDTPTPWASGATLDVIRGADWNMSRPADPIVFPGADSTVPLYRFVTESPNPRDMCNWTGRTGLPLFAMFPTGVDAANSQLTGPDGPVETCTLHAGNTSGTANAILDSENAVIVMPRDELADGVYTATINSNGGDVSWSFTIDRDAPLAHDASSVAPNTTTPSTPTTTPTTTQPPQPTTIESVGARFDPVEPFRLVDTRARQGAVRLAAGVEHRISVADAGVSAVSANFTVVNPSAAGHLTAYPCDLSTPTVSTVNFGAYQTVPNQAVVPLSDGDLCVTSHVATDLLIDVNGYFHPSGDTSFVAGSPTRLLDTRASDSSKLLAGQELRIDFDRDMAAVVLNVTVTEPAADGHLQVYPCGTVASNSNLNFVAGQTRPNSVVTALGSGQVCIRSIVDTHLVVDYSGGFVDQSASGFAALQPIRLVDTRDQQGASNPLTSGSLLQSRRVYSVQIAGNRGIPADATAVSLNATLTNTQGGNVLTLFPCGEVPTVSNVNLLPHEGAAANGALLDLSSDGRICLTVTAPVHVILDVNGVWN